MENEMGTGVHGVSGLGNRSHGLGDKAIQGVHAQQFQDLCFRRCWALRMAYAFTGLRAQSELAGVFLRTHTSKKCVTQRMSFLFHHGFQFCAS